MRKHIRVAATIVAATLSVTSSPAAAIDTKPLLREPGDRGAHTVVLDAPWNGHGIRPVARHIDRRVDGLRIIERRGADCRPNATCIRIHVGDYGIRVHCAPGASQSLQGCAQLGGQNPFMRINNHWLPPSRSTMCHELLHTLGLRHHDGRGCLAPGDARIPSRAEIRTLRRLF